MHLHGLARHALEYHNRAWHDDTLDPIVSVHSPQWGSSLLFYIGNTLGIALTIRATLRPRPIAPRFLQRMGSVLLQLLLRQLTLEPPLKCWLSWCLKYLL